MDVVAAPRARPAPSEKAARTMGLRESARVFSRYGSPRIIGVFALASVVARLVMGHWGWSDLAVCGGILVVEPFLEWIIHVYGLHMKPRNVFGYRLDPMYAKRHRMHHRDPRDIPLVFVPLPVLAGFLAFLFAFSWFAFTTRTLTVTSFATMTTFFFLYEWTHFLIHSSYVPRSFIFRAIWRNHILHHYKNEKYWFGVTNPVADYALRTRPAKDDVPTSPTARTLGVDDEFTLIGTTA